LARLNQTPASKVGKYMAMHGLLNSAPFAVENFLLYSSILGRKGASHLIEQEYLL
jgi:2'-5' RNA ligase